MRSVKTVVKQQNSKDRVQRLHLAAADRTPQTASLAPRPDVPSMSASQLSGQHYKQSETFQ